MTIVCALFVGGNLLAQEATAPASAQKPAATSKPPAPMPDVSVDDMPDEAEAILGRMREVLSVVLKFLGEAREDKDIIRLNCINDKLTSIKGILNVSEKSVNGMLELLAQKKNAEATSLFGQVDGFRGRVEQLLADAEACTGEVATYAGATQVKVTRRRGSVDPLARSSETVEVVRLPAASPYQ